MSEKVWADGINTELSKKFKLEHHIPVVFIDNPYEDEHDEYPEEEVRQHKRSL